MASVEGALRLLELEAARKQRRLRPFADGMIEAVAATRSFLLVTRNTDDVADFDSLHLENWFAS